MGVSTKEVEQEFESLKGKHKEAVSARDKQIEEYTSLLTTDSDFKPHKVKLADVPKEINTQQMAGIEKIVTED